MCKKVVDGAMDSSADVEYINLYSYDFKGCMSCFACHLKKNIENPLCFWRDDLKDILKTCLNADAIVIGSPIYYGSITSYAQAFLERLLFAADTCLIDEDIIMGIALGYESEEHINTFESPRLDLDEILKIN